ncbi:hypothetical protein U1Q18_012032, partial [Sarracenia purpurea var. burkii]
SQIRSVRSMKLEIGTARGDGVTGDDGRQRCDGDGLKWRRRWWHKQHRSVGAPWLWSCRW